MTDTSTINLRKQLAANGYSPLPNVSKICKVKGWNGDFLKREIKKHGSLDAAIETWPKRFAKYRATGARVENGLLVIDGDVEDEQLASGLAAILGEIAPEVLARAPARYGSGQFKVAWFARLEGPLFTRHGTRKYAMPAAIAAWQAELAAAVVAGRAPDPALKPDYHHVEIFGGAPTAGGLCSRQFGCFGPHTLDADGNVVVSYSWAEGPQLTDTRLEDLPAVTLDQVWAILSAFEEVAVALGWETLPEESGGDGGWVFDINPDSFRYNSAAFGQVSYAELEGLAAGGSEVRGHIDGMVTERPHDRCSVEWSDKFHCIKITDWKLGAWHVPIDKKPAEAGGLGAFKDLFEGLKAKTQKGGEDGGVFGRPLTVEDFYAYMPDHRYIHVPSRLTWPVLSVNNRLGRIGGVTAALWLDRNCFVEQVTWSPGDPVIINDKVMAEGGWIAHDGVRVFNMYRAPAGEFRAGDVDVWRDHLKRIYPGEARDIELWLAHRVQRPAEKINHALVLGGRQGIGKDTILEPLKRAIGSWNYGDVNPIQLMGRFNEFLKSVVLRVNEVRDRGETDRYAFYNHTKIMIAAPPDTLLIDGKNLREHRIPNVVGMIITLNEKASLYLPDDDRRHFVAWSEATLADFHPEYFNQIYRWYAAGGLDAVASYLSRRDLTGFDAKRPPRKTVAFHDIVDMSRAPEDVEMMSVLERLGWPDAVTIDEVQAMAGQIQSHEFAQYLRAGSANARKIKHRFNECGYIPLRSDTKSGLWFVRSRRMAIYVRSDLSEKDRQVAARAKADEVVVDMKGRSDGGT